MTPIIGVTASLKADSETVATRPLGYFVRADFDYVSGVVQAGGVPVVLPPIVETAEELARAIDGLLLTGGSDLAPSYYGERPLPELGEVIPERDAFEMAVLEHALERGMPVFGICRGLQLLNVSLGGTLYQDLPSQLTEGSIAHRQQTPKWQWTHEVEMDADSNVAGFMGSTSLRVNSYHHQAIKDLAGDLLAVGHASDGIIEAIEYRDLSEHWLVGVQWHAEAMRDMQSTEERRNPHRNLFKAHVAAAGRHALRRAAA